MFVKPVSLLLKDVSLDLNKFVAHIYHKLGKLNMSKGKYVYENTFKSLPRSLSLVKDLAMGFIFVNSSKYLVDFTIASSLSEAVSSINPTFKASSVLNNLPVVSANSASLALIVLFIVAMNQNGATIPNFVSLRPMVKLLTITRYSQLIANKHPPAGE